MKIGPIEDLTSWKKSVKERLGDKQLIASVSGGKDSTAMALLLKEADIPFSAIFIDTGWEHKVTYQYIDNYLPQFIGPISKLQNPNGGMEALIKKRNDFPSKWRRFCTTELKIRPIRKYLRNLEDEPVNCVGIRAQESRKRSTYPEWEFSDDLDCWVWRPLIRFLEEDVILLHQRHGVRPNPLYLVGARRVGCWPCIFTSKAEIRIIAKEDPERIDKIRKLEQQISASRAKLFPNSKPSTWFRLKSKKYGSSIDQVLQWAHEDPFTHELLSTDERESGCMRWGLCEMQHPFEAQDEVIRVEDLSTPDLASDLLPED